MYLGVYTLGLSPSELFNVTLVSTPIVFRFPQTAQPRRPWLPRPNPAMKLPRKKNQADRQCN
jgi:hypothetical protein